MAYRDDRQALVLQVDELERENTRLRRELAEMAQRVIDRERRAAMGGQVSGRAGRCTACGGNLLPIAVFAGHDLGHPQPIHMSTLRFQSPGGGFTHAAAVHAKACTSCGFIHNYVHFDHARDEVATEEA